MVNSVDESPEDQSTAPLYTPCQKLRLIRKNDLDMNQTAFAAYVGCPHAQWISDWERGARPLSPATREAIAKKLRRATHVVFPEFCVPCVRLKEFINRLNLSYAQVALIAGLPRERIMGFTKGTLSPSDAEAMNLTLVFDAQERQRLIDAGYRIDVDGIFPGN